jgi:exosortase F-associated protein
MNNLIRYLFVGLSFILLICVRVFVEPYFYDPLIEYFKSDYLHEPLPSLDISIYFAHLSFRYFLNSIISLAIIHLFFMRKTTLIFALKIYFVCFLILIFLLFVLLKFHIVDGYLTIFYIRRILIHPLLLLVLIPAFYYQKLKLREGN